MLLIYCPNCLEHREEEEFSYGGEAHIARPLNPETLSDTQWADYLFSERTLEEFTMKCGITRLGVGVTLMQPEIP